MKPKRFANLTSVCFRAAFFFLAYISSVIILYSSYKHNCRIRIYRHFFLFVSATFVLYTFVLFCVFVCSWCIGGFDFFPGGNFSDRAFYGDFIFSTTLQNFCCRITEINFFRSCVSFSRISLVCVQSHRLLACVHSLRQRPCVPLQATKKTKNTKRQNPQTKQTHHYSTAPSLETIQWTA